MSIKIAETKKLAHCSICTHAKQTRCSFKRSAPRATRRLAHIHIDISGGGETFDNSMKLIPNYNEYNYIMIITNDATCFCWEFLLETKDQIYEILKV